MEIGRGIITNMYLCLQTLHLDGSQIAPIKSSFFVLKIDQCHVCRKKDLKQAQTHFNTHFQDSHKHQNEESLVKLDFNRKAFVIFHFLLLIVNLPF